jgi:hypothetical protein
MKSFWSSRHWAGRFTADPCSAPNNFCTCPPCFTAVLHPAVLRADLQLAIGTCTHCLLQHAMAYVSTRSVASS